MRFGWYEPMEVTTSSPTEIQEVRENVADQANNSASNESAVAVGEVQTVAALDMGHAKIRVGLKTKIFVTTGMLLTLSSMIGTTMYQVLRPTPHVDLDRLFNLLKENPSLRHPALGALENSPNSYRVWERYQAKDDGLPFYDADFDRDSMVKSEARRDATTVAPPINSTSTEASISVTSEAKSATIEFRNYGCNVIQKNWVCSKPHAPFCVYFSTSVPAATKIMVNPMESAPVVTTAADSRVAALKCKGKLPVSYVSAVLE